MARCDLCGGKIKPPKKRFCCNKHKDRYHNIHNPRGKFAHLHPDNMSPDELMDSIHDEIHPYSSEAFGE